LLWCFAGCATSDVLAALDLGMSDLFDNRRNATYGYKDGRQVRRWYGDNGKRQFSQFGVRGTTAVLYRLEEVKAAVAAGEPVYVCEGEKDCHAIEALGAVATTAPMGAANFGKVDVSPLYGANVIAIRHKDEAGDAWAVQVHEKLDGEAASFQFRQAKIGNDAADHIAAELGLADFEPADIEDENARVRRLLPRINWHALWADHAEEEWILYPLVPVRRLVALYSPPKIGKSLISLEVAVGISRGETVLGYTPSKRWRVLYVDFENDPRGDIRERLQAMGCGPDDLDHLDYLSFPAPTTPGWTFTGTPGSG